MTQSALYSAKQHTQLHNKSIKCEPENSKWLHVTAYKAEESAGNDEKMEAALNATLLRDLSSGREVPHMEFYKP